MWLSCGGICLGALIIYRLFMNFDYFRLLLYFSPGLITLVWAPSQRETTAYGVVGFSAVLFVLYWTAVQVYPAQCRHAWGARMVLDGSFYSNSTILNWALAQEKKDYFYMGGVAPLGHDIFYPSERSGLRGRAPSPSNDNALPTPPPELDEQKVAELEQGGLLNAGDLHPEPERVKKWIAPITGGTSKNVMLLRMYCQIHGGQNDTLFIYPLKDFGISKWTFDFSVPCPNWTCTMTEPNPGGQLPFLFVLAAMLSLNFFHYRCDCLPNHEFQTWFGAGKCRLWWVWFWAALLPLMLVMWIKTSHDMELLEYLWYVITQISDTWSSFFALTNEDGSTNEAGKFHSILFDVLGGIGLLAAVYYRDALRRHSGIDIFVNMCNPSKFPEEHNTFQACVWRVDLVASSMALESLRNRPSEGSPRAGGSPRTGGSPGAGREVRSLAAVGSLAGLGSHFTAAMGHLGGYLPLIRLSGEDRLRTPDQSVPALAVRFKFKGDVIKSTRAVRPTWAEWRNSDSVYFQENFRINLDWQPGEELHVEVYDTNTGNGLSSLVMDEQTLLRDFDTALLNADPDAGATSVATTQVVSMMGPMPRAHDDQIDKVESMICAGFSAHKLDQGGAVWLAFAEVGQGQSVAVAGVPFLPCG